MQSVCRADGKRVAEPMITGDSDSDKARCRGIGSGIASYQVISLQWALGFGMASGCNRIGRELLNPEQIHGAKSDRIARTAHSGVARRATRFAGFVVGQ